MTIYGELAKKGGKMIEGAIIQLLLIIAFLGLALLGAIGTIVWLVVR